MKTLKTKGIVIRTLDYDESSKIAYVFTPLGILSVLAKGARRIKSKFLNFAENMNYVEICITDSTFPRLIDYTLLDSYYEIKEDLKKNLWFSYLLEITNKLPHEIKYQNTFNLLSRILELGKTNDPMLLALIFQIKALALYGVSPVFDKCVVCNSNEIVSFSVSQGGACCINHDNEHKKAMKDFDAMKKLYYFDIYHGSLEELKDIDLISLFKLVTEYYEYHVEIKLHSYGSLII